MNEKSILNFKNATCKVFKAILHIIPINKMLFMNKDEQYVEILRKNYLSDTAYYTAIMKLRGNVTPPPTATSVNLLPLGLRL